MKRDQRPKKCAGGCGRTTRGVHCATCYAKIPARERSGEFGKFQLTPSHLITGNDAPAPARTVSDEVHRARLMTAELALRQTGMTPATVEATRDALDLLGIGAPP